MRILGWLALLVFIGAIAAFLDEWMDPPQAITASGQQIRVADGDSFAIGPRKLRLDGIDAPEYLQKCTDSVGIDWECGRVARASLDKMIRRPGLSCQIKAADQYGRSIATCAAPDIADIGSAQVLGGLAVSHEYFGIRDYGDEEDQARDAKRGIWIGEFMPPAEWRAAHAALRMNTVPAE
jgi:endonuclease YncB( thermonuclease family)